MSKQTSGTLPNIVELQSGLSRFYARSDKGDVFAWGWGDGNIFGGLRNGTYEKPRRLPLHGSIIAMYQDCSNSLFIDRNYQHNAFGHYSQLFKKTITNLSPLEEHILPILMQRLKKQISDSKIGIESTSRSRFFDVAVTENLMNQVMLSFPLN